MKYIIDLNPDCVDGEFLRMPIRVAGEDQWIKTKASLTPYTEPSHKAVELQHANDILKVARMNYYKGAEDGWSLAGDIVYYMSFKECVDAGMLCDDDIYESTSGVLEKLTYQEAKEKYESWLRQKNEIRVGCEVHHKELPELKIYVTDMDDNSFGGFALCRVEDVCEYGDRFSECNVHQYKPTGRVLPNIVELLKKMKGKEE